MISTTVVLAHQGGWDEILMVVGPLVIVGLGLFVATRKLKARAAASLATNEEA